MDLKGKLLGGNVARLVVGAVLAASVGFGAETASVLTTRTPVAAPIVSAQTAPNSGDFSTAVRNVAQQVKPAIVQITTSQNAGGFNQAVPQQTGVGSGVIFDSQGHILTNNHVVAGADTLSVALPDGRSFDGKVVGTDPQTDLAVVQITGDNLPMASLGDSSQVAVGDWVVAIGNALALPGGPTVTAGVVSATGRSVQEPSDPTTGQAGPFLYDVIQTDASINPGNSGGALVNLQGQVIGINTLVAGMAEPGVQAQGIGFAIAMNTAKPIADELVATGHAVHPFLGVNYSALTPTQAARLGIPSNTQGILIASVVPNSPAAQAGLQARDVVTAVEGQKITDESTLGKVLFARKPGDTVTLTVLRGGQSMDIKATLGTRPSGS